jgi:hypothetical protein
VLATAMKALPDQWREHFGYEPVMAEIFTDLERFHGTCYKACGWIEAGERARASGVTRSTFVLTTEGSSASGSRSSPPNLDNDSAYVRLG